MGRDRGCNPVTLAAELESRRVLAILRRRDIAEVVLDVFELLHEEGIRAVEVTIDQPQAVGALRRLVDYAPPDVFVGAGTVVTVKQLNAVADTGASFVVC